VADELADVVRMENITKRFPGVVANKSVNFHLSQGEVHGLLGENGAGKTTLMSILSGYYQADEGQIYVKNEAVRIRSPKDALKLGIGMVYQHFSLVPNFTVVENISLGLDATGRKVKDLNALAEELNERAGQLGFTMDPWANVWELSVGEQQRVEILKVLTRGANIIILDEPTSVLAPVEVEGLFRTIMLLKNQGKSIVFITHKLPEATEFCDRITVLRSGIKVGTLGKGQFKTPQQIVKMMFGTEMAPEATRQLERADEPVLRAEALVVLDDRGHEAVRNLNLTLHKGEIMGLAGVEGNGQKELAEAIVGIRPLSAGRITIDGRNVTSANPAVQYDMGVAYITDDRVGEGLVPDLTLAENLVLKSFRGQHFRKGMVVDWRKAERETAQLIDEYAIAARGPKSVTRTLSGGNLQKLLVARELWSKPLVLVASQPAHGLDVRTTQYIHKKLMEHAEQGTAVLLISNDLDEIFTLSDTIAVIYRGEILGQRARHEVTREQIAHLMVGIREYAGPVRSPEEV